MCHVVVVVPCAYLLLEGLDDRIKVFILDQLSHINLKSTGGDCAGHQRRTRQVTVPRWTTCQHSTTQRSKHSQSVSQCSTVRYITAHVALK